MNELILLALSLSISFTPSQWNSFGEMACLDMVEELAIVEAEEQYYHLTSSSISRLRYHFREDCQKRSKEVKDIGSFITNTEIMRETLPLVVKATMTKAIRNSTHKL